MPIDKTIDDLAKVLLSRQNMTQAGRYLAEGFAAGGMSPGFSSNSPTGIAGGRGDTDKIGDASRDLTSAYKDTTKTLEKEQRLRKVMNSQYAEHNVLMKNLRSTLKHLDPNMSDFGQQMKDVGGVVSDRMQEISDSFETYGKQQKFWAKVQRKTGIDMQKLEKGRIRALRMLEKGTEKEHIVKKKLKELEEKRVELLDRANELKEREISLAQKFSIGAFLGMMLDAARRFADDVGAQFRYGTIGSIAEQQKMSVMLGGADPQALSELSSQSRMATIAMGGQAAMSDAMFQKQWENVKITGDVNEAARHTTEMLQALGEAGIRPSLREFDALTTQFDYLHRMTGMTAEAYRGMFTSLTQNADIRQRLQALDKDERRRQLQGIMLRIKENVAMGMTIQQAQRAAEALAAMAGEGPRERFKKAAQLQMAAGALGIEGAAEAAQALRLGDRATPEQQRVLEQVMKDLANARAESRTGMLGMEFAIDRMTQGLPEAGKDSPFVTTMTEALRPEGHVARSIATTAEQGGVMNTTLIGIAATVKGIENIISNSALGSMAASAVGAGASLLGIRALKGPLTRLLGRFGIGAGASAASGAAAGGGAGGLLARLGGARNLAVRGGLAGGLLYSGKKAYDFYSDDEKRYTMTENWGRNITRFMSIFSDDAKYRLEMMDQANAQAEQQRTSQAELADPMKRTAENSDRQLSQSELQTKLLETLVEMNAGSITTADAQARIANLQMGMLQSTVPGT